MNVKLFFIVNFIFFSISFSNTKFIKGRILDKRDFCLKNALVEYKGIKEISDKDGYFTLAITTSISNNKIKKKPIILYSLTTNGLFHFYSDSEDNQSSISLFNSKGKLLVKKDNKKINFGKNKINIGQMISPSIGNGVFFLVIKNNFILIQLKFIIFGKNNFSSFSNNTYFDIKQNDAFSPHAIKNNNTLIIKKNGFFKEDVKINTDTIIDTVDLGNIILDLNIDDDTIDVPFDLSDVYKPSGLIGDAKNGNKCLLFNNVCKENPRPGDNDNLCIKINYHKENSFKWAGIYWQYPENNWGEKSGKVITGAEKLVFWACGGTGTEKLELLSGNIKGQKYEDSYFVTLGQILLSKEWKQYVINLSNKDLSMVIGPFAWASKFSDNPNGLIFYLDELRFE